jgi:hypothetical protein
MERLKAINPKMRTTVHGLPGVVDRVVGDLQHENAHENKINPELFNTEIK